MIPWESCVLWLGYPLQCGLWPDISKHDNDGVVTGGCWKEDSMSFDGVDDGVNCGKDSSIDLADELTICVLLRTDGTTREEICSKWKDIPPYNGYICDVTDTGYVRMSTHENSPTKYRYRDSSVTIDDSEWHHVVMIRHDKHLHFYIDGVSCDGTEHTGEGGAPNVIGSPNENFLVAEPGYSEANNYTGQIASVLVFDIALTADQAKEAYQQTYRKV